MNSQICLSCEGIERYLGEEEERVHALRGVSLEVQAGSVHAVVGPSGCGKSTLLYVLGLLDSPDTGQVAIESEPVSHLSDDELARRRNKFIGFIFQFHFLMEDFTTQENVMIPMRKLGQLSDAQMRERAADLLEAVGLGDKLRRPSRHLSGGEQQRVAIARALANNPRVILRRGGGVRRPPLSSPAMQNILPILIADAPEALIELCGVNLLERLLRILQRLGFRRAIVFSTTPEIVGAELARRSWPRNQ